jgi:aminocarboxymuconate-semialdehyde decarboxylase
MPLTIDLHQHAVPDFYGEITGEKRGVSVGGIATAPWHPDDALAYMDEAEIDAGVLSISAPGVHFGDDAAACELARRCNEFLAELVRSRPDRFGFFAILPLPDVEGALDELAYATDVLGSDGVVLLSNAAGVYLGDARLQQVFDELQRRRAVAFIHPTGSPDAAASGLRLPPSLIDFVADTTRAVASMHYHGTFARTPDVTYILSHAGGTVPYLANRFAVVDELGAVEDTQGRGTAADTFRRLYWDTALSWTDPTLHTLREVAGTEHVVLGSDFPFLRSDLAVGGIKHLRTTEELTDPERSGLLGATAARLLPRLAR